MQEFVRKTFSRRGLLKSSGSSIGTLFVLSQATGLPIPLLMQIDRAMAVTPVETKMFIMVQNTDGIRPNDFNMAEAQQPEFLSRTWNPATDLIAATHAPGNVSMLPPGIGTLAKYADRMAILVGVDTQNNGHDGGSRNATTNATAGIAAATSFHTIVGRASSDAFTIPSVNFSGVEAVTEGAGSGGVSPQGFLASLQIPPGPAAAVLTRLDQFRNAFHNEVVKALSKDDQAVIGRYWDSNTSFKTAKEQAAALFNQAAPANTFAGQLEMARRIYSAGLSNAFIVDGTGGQGFGFDTHGGNGPQRTLAKGMSDTLSAFLDAMAAVDQLDQVNVMVTTAFGRNPTFNGAGGDDHLPSNGHYTLIGPDFKPGSFGKTSNTAATARGVVGWAVQEDTGEVAEAPNPGGKYHQLFPAVVLKSVADAIGVPRTVSDQYFPNTDVLDFLKK